MRRRRRKKNFPYMSCVKALIMRPLGAATQKSNLYWWGFEKKSKGTNSSVAKKKANCLAWGKINMPAYTAS